MQVSFAAPAPAPREAVQRTVDNVLATLRDPRFKSAVERRRQLQAQIEERFDFAEMARRSLGRHWQSRTPAERKEFVEAFRDVLINSYLSTIESYRGEKLRYVRERVENGYAEVDTLIVDERGQEYSVNYRLHRAGDQWKIYDVVIEGVSLVSNYRSQFDRLIRRDSFEELLKRMRRNQIDAPGTVRK
jgi:phospholipid transport system substrate-binding protein